MRRRQYDTAVVGPSALIREGLARVLGSADYRVVISASDVQDIASGAKHRPALLLIDSVDPESTLCQIKVFRQQYPSVRIAVLTDHFRLHQMVAAFRAGANLCFAKQAESDAFLKALDLIMLGETILPPELLALIRDHEPEGHCESPGEHRAAGDRRAADDGPAGAPMDGPIAGPMDGRAANGVYAPFRPAPSDALEAPAGEGVEVVAHLSGREKCILRCMVGGDSNKRIARRIDIAEATVKVHVKAILRKVRVHNRTQAAIWALNNFASIWPVETAPPCSVAPSLVPGDPIRIAAARQDSGRT
jgi:two-component system, NarL family, nitrate/nitrite response regulator NarL